MIVNADFLNFYSTTNQLDFQTVQLLTSYAYCIKTNRKLVDPTPNRFEQLVTQMKWRLNEGGGKAIYKLGVDDDGHISGLCQSELMSSLATLERMAKRLNATLHPLRERIIEPVGHDDDSTNSINKEYRKAIELLVRLAPTTNDGSPDLCVALVGGMDSGKSTLIGVLTDGELDNARGKARLNLFRHLHEVQSGRTSSLSRELLGFDADGNVTNYKYADGRVYRRSAEEVVRMSSNLITLIDLAGHSRYQRTTLSGIACNQPVMSILVISATIGLTTIGLEHIQLIRSLNLPMIVVLTKIDQLSSGGEQLKRINSIYRQLVYQFKQIEYAWSYNNGIPIWNERYSMFTNNWELNSNKDSNGSQCMPPFFPVSSVTGQGIDHLIKFLSRLSCLNQSIDGGLSLKQEKNQPTSNQPLNNTIEHVKQAQSFNSTDIFLASNENQIQLMLSKISEEIKIIKTYRDFNGTLFWINQVYTQIPGVCNPVLVGRVQLGQLLNNQILWLGPDHFGDFYPVQIVSLMHNRQVHEIVYAGQLASMEVHFLPKSWNTLSYTQRIHILQNISSSYNNSNNNTNGIMNQQNKRSQYLLFGNDNDNTGNEENIPYNEEPDDDSNTDKMWHSSVKLRRGMVLLTYPMLINKHLSKSSLLSPTNPNSPSTSSNLSPLSSSSSASSSSSLSPSSAPHPPPPSSYDAFIWNQPLLSKDSINFSVAWTVKLRLTCRLPIVSFKLGTPPIILTPIPSIGQRVTIYAGCICQTGVVIDGRIEEYQRSQYDQCGNNNNNNNVNNKNHLEDTSHLYVRFTRQPECVEIGRQFILTWNGNLKTVGYVIDLIDPLKCNSSISPLLNNETSSNNNNKEDASQLINDSGNDFIWRRQNTLSFHEKDDYDSSWSSLRMNFIDRIMNTTHDSGNNNNNSNNLQYFYHKSKSLSLSMEEFADNNSNYTSTNEKFDSMHYTTSIHLSSLLEAEIENQENQKKCTDLSSGGVVLM
ncbi:unnamed protein product [Trichobilharzia szidati]|nr:unnamed protein product [Trichobilharzia szidati]